VTTAITVDWDVPVEMDDGAVLRADVFRPPGDGRYPVLMAHGPYAKGLDFAAGYPSQWQQMVDEFPEVTRGTTGRYQNWEHVDPEKWVPDGYVCVRVDSRGAGRSPGRLDVFSARETADYYQCIEWAAAQPWCDGQVGLIGISYYAMNQWQVAGTRPPHLAAICVWEGAADFYRDVYRHGGIGSDFGLGRWWYHGQITRVQHGVGERGPRSLVTGELVAGPPTLSDPELAARRAELADDVLAHELDDEYYRSRGPDLAAIEVPLLSAGNWGGQGLHLRGNIEGFLAAGSPAKWLEIHGNSHFSPFYCDRGVALQKRFFGHFLKGLPTGWPQQPPVELQIRHPGERFVRRAEQEWPLARTQWRRFYLDPAGPGLTGQPATGPPLSYRASGEGITFLTEPLPGPVEITGPAAATLHLSADADDADVFLALRVFGPDGTEVTFQGANDPMSPVSLGWLRASHRKLDPERSLPYRPYHPHDEVRPLTPGEPAELQVEIWPTCIAIPAGYRIGLTVRGRDYENEAHYVPHRDEPMRGVASFTHSHPRDRPRAIRDAVNTLHFIDPAGSYLLLPVIPPA
jgi:uncharacterized protein